MQFVDCIELQNISNSDEDLVKVDFSVQRNAFTLKFVCSVYSALTMQV